MLKKIIHNTTFTRNVALPGIIVLVLLSLLSALFPLRVNNWLTFVQSFIYKNLSWMYILLVSFFVIFLLAVAFSKLGNIRLGADNSEPQYGFFSWIAMLFAAGMGIGLMYFGVSEPMSYYVYPALPTIVNKAKDAQLALVMIAIFFVTSADSGILVMNSISTGNDIQYLSKDEIIADVLREYGRYISSISDNRNAMVFVDKKPQ